MGPRGTAYEGREGPHPEVLLSELARRRHTLVTTAELAALGIRGSAVERRVACGRLHRQHRGVFSVGHAGLTREGRWLAAVLASGEGAVLSHLDAAALWAIYDRTAAHIHVTTARRGRKGTAGIRIHRARRLAAADVILRDGIPVTSVARTLVDLSDLLGRERLTRVVREAEYLRLLDLDELDAAVARARGRRNLATLVAAVEAHRPGAIVREELEHRFQELCRTAALPVPLTNVPIELRGRTKWLDCLWPDERVVVELDSRRAHDTADRFESDRARDSALIARDYLPLRFTWRRVTGDGAAVAAELRAVLDRRRTAATPARPRAAAPAA